MTAEGRRARSSDAIGLRGGLWLFQGGDEGEEVAAALAGGLAEEGKPVEALDRAQNAGVIDVDEGFAAGGCARGDDDRRDVAAPRCLAAGLVGRALVPG